MTKYYLPFEEYQRGWYEIEADSLEEAQAIVRVGDFSEYLDPNYKDGYTTWDIDMLQEARDD